MGKFVVKKPKNILSDEETWEISRKLYYKIKLVNSCGFADTTIRPVPDIQIYKDMVQFYSSELNLIHIGVLGIVAMFGCTTEEEFWEALTFIRGHEEEHCRSTAHRPYENGITQSFREVVKFIASKEEKKPRFFRKETDYEDYLNELRKRGIFVSVEMILDFCRALINGVEDGRIERIRASRYPGYELLRVKYRGMNWRDNVHDFKPYEEIKDNAAEKLKVIQIQIHSLATCQVYSRGFKKAYDGTPLKTFVDSLKPYIGRAYIANKCKDMAKEVIEIVKILAPLIYEACKAGALDIAIRKLIEDMIREMIERAIESNLQDPGGALREQDEQEGKPEMPKSTFPISDLEITLPDDVYDKLVKQSKQSQRDDQQGGIIVKREHPKEEKKQEQEEGNGKGKGQSQSNQQDSGTDAQGNDGSENKDGKTDGSKNQEQSQTKGASQSGTEGDEKDGDEVKTGAGQSTYEEQGEESQQGAGSGSGEVQQDGQEASGEGQSDGSMQGAGQSGQEGGQFGQKNSNASSGQTGSEVQDDTPAALTESKSGGSNSMGGKSEGSGGRGSSELGEPDMDKILQAMEEAANKTRVEAATEMANVNAHAAYEKRMENKHVVVDKEPPISAKEMSKAINQSFKEVKRSYKVTDKLPPVLQARGRAMFRKNQRYFKSLSRPTVKNIDSGSVDPSRIYGLSFGDTDVFQKIGKDKKFDGCAYMLIDNSGSMRGGGKREEAAKAGAIVEEGFRKMFPLKIVAFDEYGAIIHEVIKNWDEWLGQNCCWNYALHGREGCGNEDGYDIMVATKELLARPEKKKMLVVLSDGAPGDQGLVKKAVREARKKGIEVYSIYFECGRVTREAEQIMEYMYEKDFVVCPLDELDEHLYKLFKKFSRK